MQLTARSFEKQFVLFESRQYIQGSTITHGLLEAVEKWNLGPIERIQLNIHALMVEHGCYDLFTENAKPVNAKKKYHAVFRLFGPTETYWVGLKGNGTRVSKREPYDEERLIEGYQLEKANKCIALYLEPHPPAVNIMIALHKKLANYLFPGEGYSQWYLSRYDLSWNAIHIRQSKKMEIVNVGSVGMSHIHSTISVDNEEGGSIYFSRHKK